MIHDNIKLFYSVNNEIHNIIKNTIINFFLLIILNYVDHSYYFKENSYIFFDISTYLY